ncbi:MAG: DUF3592 domain-containing protein [Luteolibacter sp.]
MFRKLSQPKKAATPLAGGCLSLFGLPFFAAGAFMSFLYFSGLVQWWQAQRWEEVPCRIESAELKKSSDSDSTSYKTTAIYHYRYHGRDYRGDRVSFGSGSDNVGSFQHDAHQELTAHSRTGQPFRCYVDPSKPESSVLYRILRWQLQAFLSIFVLTFPAVGAGLVLVGILGLRESKVEGRLRNAFPDKRWKWKTAWAGQSIPEVASRTNLAIFAYTIWFWLAVAPLIAAMLISGAFQNDRPAWAILILPLIGCIPAWQTFKRVRHRMAVGKCQFELRDWPANPGGSLRGEILLARPLPTGTTVELTVECTKSFTRSSGDGSSTTTEKFWSHQENVPSQMIRSDLSGCRVPVVFQLPTAPESTLDLSETTRYRWNLHLRVPGTSIHSVFEIPVFRDGQTITEGAVVETPAIPVPTDELPALLASRKIQSNFDANGFPISILCPPARNFSIILFLTLFNLVWTAVAAFLIIQHAPLIFRLVWPISATAIWCSIIWMALHKRSVTFDGNGLVITHQFALVIWKHSFGKKDIVGFSHDTNMSSGNQSFYRVRLESVIGKKETLADGITESNTAAALVSQLEKWKQSQA